MEYCKLDARSMPSWLASMAQRQLWVSSRKFAEQHLVHARQLLSSQEPADIQSALDLIETALKLFPQWEKAIELKARALLGLRRFKEVADLLWEFIPSLTNACDKLVENDKAKLLPANDSKKEKTSSWFSSFALKSKNLWVSIAKGGQKEQWRYSVLGQACCHLGMMEDAMILLSIGKRAASVVFRQQSNGMPNDSFNGDDLSPVESDSVANLLSNIKFLLRRRTAALAALEAGLFSEAARHLTKILDGRKGTPQGFVAECYMYRAMSYQAANRIVDAIADCNRTLALNPFCAEALSTRATLYEGIGGFSDCLQDLERLKDLCGKHHTCPQDSSGSQKFQFKTNLDNRSWSCIDNICSGIAAVKEKMGCHSHRMVDYHKVLGMSRGCSRRDVEKAYLLLSLRHRPEKAAHFVDRCELVGERGIDVVKDEARTSGLKLFRLIQRGYTCIMAQMLEEEMKREMITMALGESASNNDELLLVCGVDSKDAQNGISVHSPVDECEDSSCIKEERISVKEGACKEQVDISADKDREWGDQISQLSSCTKSNSQCEELQIFPALESFSEIGEAKLLPQIVATCIELANVGSIMSQGLPSEAWMGATEWTHSHHPLPVT